MQPVVETLSGLERRIDLAVSVADIEKEVQAQLKRMARTAKAPGFRPGKVPLAMLERSHGPGIRYDVINNQVGRAFEQAIGDAKLRVAGSPTVRPKAEGVANDTLAFIATFEVYPEIPLPDLSVLSVTRYQTSVTEVEVERTLTMLRTQRATFEVRADRAAQEGDRVALDFAGTIDGAPFEGGDAENFSFILGQGRILPEGEQAIRGLRAGESKVFPLTFPDNYHVKEVAGKTAQLSVTLKEVAEAILPPLDSEFAKSLGQAEGDLEQLKIDIRHAIERQVKTRAQGRTKASVIEALSQAATFDVPKTLIDNEARERIAATRQELKKRGMDNADAVPMSTEAFAPEAERRVRLGLMISELVKQVQLQPKPEQVRAIIEELAQNYDQPAQVISYYLADRQRRADIEAMALEDNVVAHVLEKAKVTDVQVPFDELMGMA